VVDNSEKILVRFDHTEVPILKTVTRIQISGKEKLMESFVDISLQKDAEKEMQKARIEAEKANLAKSEFLSRMSHELRTPMNSILGFAQLLEMGELNSSQNKGVKHILHSGKHLLDLINEVLDISRIESGNISLSLEPIRVSSVIQETIEIAMPLANKLQLKIDFEGAVDKPIFVKSDRQRLKQILINLISNAVKYNKTGGSVSLKTELMPVNGEGITPVRISVIDTGPGISADDLPKLFIPFERIGADKSITEGSGLGLTVVKKIMGALGGTIGVESVLGVGSTFWFELPHVENPLENRNKNGNLTDLESNQALNKGTILYIEDNESNIELVEQIISSQRSKINLITKIYGKQAVPSAIEYQPDLILLDLDLPDIHGSEVLKRLLAEEKTSKIPVIIISAVAGPKQIEKLMNAGAKKYMTKPLDVSLFLKTIDMYIVN